MILLLQLTRGAVTKRKKFLKKFLYYFKKGLVESDKLRPVIDRTYTMNEMVAAHSYVETGRKKGNVAITISLN